MGVWQSDRVEIIANDQGNRTTPSYVGFTDTERLIGDAAKNQVAMNPRNTVFDAKRLIGRHFSDPAVQEDMRHWSFTVVQGPGDKPLIQGEEGVVFGVFVFLFVVVGAHPCWRCSAHACVRSTPPPVPPKTNKTNKT